MSVWDIHNPKAPLWSRTPYKEEVQCIDWSPDGKWIASASRDGMAYLHNAENGNIETELHTLLLLHTGDDRYRFRAIKFIPGKPHHQIFEQLKNMKTIVFNRSSKPQL